MKQMIWRSTNFQSIRYIFLS